MRNNFVYSYSIKICALGFEGLLHTVFCLLLVMEAFSLQKVVKMHEAVVRGWQEVRQIWWMKHNSVAQFVQLLKLWLCYVPSGIVVGKNWASSVDQRWLQMLPFSVHLIDLLSIVLKCNGFVRIQKGFSRESDGQQAIKQ